MVSSLKKIGKSCGHGSCGAKSGKPELQPWNTLPESIRGQMGNTGQSLIANLSFLFLKINLPKIRGIHETSVQDLKEIKGCSKLLECLIAPFNSRGADRNTNYKVDFLYPNNLHRFSSVLAGC